MAVDVTFWIFCGSTFFRHMKPMLHCVIPEVGVILNAVTVLALFGVLKYAQVPAHKVAPTRGVEGAAEIVNDLFVVSTALTFVFAASTPVPPDAMLYTR
jgi:hypothetical protein